MTTKTLTDPGGTVHAQWDGDEVPSTLARLPNESATFPYILRTGGRELVAEPGRSVLDEVRRLLGGGEPVCARHARHIVRPR